MKWIIVFGTVIEGHRFIGPFMSERAAREWADEHGFQEGEIVALGSPKDACNFGCCDAR